MESERVFFFGQVPDHYNDSLFVFMYIKNFLLKQFFLSRWFRRSVPKYAASHNHHVQPYIRVAFKTLNIANFVADFHEIWKYVSDYSP